jgi:putative membrane protein
MADSDLKRTHPATVAVKAGRALFQWVLIFIVFGFFRAGSGSDLLAAFGYAGMALAISVLIIALTWVSWWRFTYGIEGKDLVILEGLWVRKRRTIPLARIQGVNVRADLFMRALGLVELRVQTAGGDKEPEAKIGSIPLADAEVLRAALLRGHRTAEEAAGQDAPRPFAPGLSGGSAGDVSAAGSDAIGAEQDAPPTLVGADPVGRMSDLRGAFGGAEIAREEASFEYALSLARLALAAITSKQVTIIFLIGFAAFGQLGEFLGPAIFEQAGAAAAALSVPVVLIMVVAGVLLGLGVSVVVGVARTFGFTVRRVDNRVETEAGLVERRMTALPVGRVQTISIEETWIRRVLGYAAVYVETAGYGKSDEDRGALSKAAVIPLAKLGEIMPLIQKLLPEVRAFPSVRPLPRRSLRFYLFVPMSAALLIGIVASTTSGLAHAWSGIVLAGVTLVVLVIVALTRYGNWKMAGLGSDADAITIRSGLIGRKLVRLSRSRIQSLTVRQNPFQKRRNLVTLTAVSISGSSGANHSVSHVPADEATRVMAWYEKGLRATTRPVGPAPGGQAPVPIRPGS